MVSPNNDPEDDLIGDAVPEAPSMPPPERSADGTADNAMSEELPLEARGDERVAGQSESIVANLEPVPPTETGDELVGDAIPKSPPPAEVEKLDLTAPWYRPAKQFLRRQQWNADILHLLNRRPDVGVETDTISYIGLPGQHYLDVISMGRICNAKKLQIEYLGFRIGDGPDVVEHLGELSALSNQSHFTKNSKCYPDSVRNIGLPNTLATKVFVDRAPFDVINLDVCGGVLHGDTTPLLRAIKYVLSNQAQRDRPWLLFVTTTAKAEDIEADVIAKFFSTIRKNCENGGFNQALTETTTKHIGLSVEECLADPARLPHDGFLRYFTLAFGKWLLANLFENDPRSTITLRSVYSFRNTDRDEPEMLSLAYLVSPVIGGGHDPTELTPAGDAANQDYGQIATSLVVPSVDGLLDLDLVWDEEPEMKRQIIQECEDLLRTIGADDAQINEWRERHGIPATNDA